MIFTGGDLFRRLSLLLFPSLPRLFIFSNKFVVLLSRRKLLEVQFSFVCDRIKIQIHNYFCETIQLLYCILEHISNVIWK